MTAPFSLSSIDAASLDWPELPELDTRLDVLAPTPWALPGGAGGRELGACIDELAATRALTELLDARTRSARQRAGMCLRASFTVECNPARWVPVHASRSAYDSPDVDATWPPADGASLSVQAWLANLAPLATLALLLGAWFMWLH